MKKLLALFLLLPGLALASIQSVIPNNTIVGNATGATAAPRALTSLPSGIQILGYDTPEREGAVGNGVADDTTFVQTCVTTKACRLVCGSKYLVSSPIKIIITGSIFVGCGKQSALVGNNVTGAVLQVGDTGVHRVYSVVVGNFRILGNASQAVYVTQGIAMYMDKIWANWDSINDAGISTPNFNDGFWLDYTFDSTFTNLSTDGSNVGLSAIAFTTNVAGATSGTLSAVKANGVYDFIFYSGEQRVVTITGGTAATWSNALAASPTMSGCTITGTAGQFTCTAPSNLIVGQQVILSGTYGGTGSITGYSNPTTYAISVTNNTTTFTLTTVAGGAIVTTAGTPTGITYTLATSVAYHGADFRIGGAFNANYCSNWTTSGFPGAYSIYMGDDLGSGASSGNTFDAMALQGSVIGLYVGSNQYDDTFNSLYSESAVKPIVIGSAANSINARAITFNSPVLNGPATNHRAYMLRIALVDIDYASGITFNSPDFGGSYGIDAIAPLTFSGGAATAQATGFGVPNAAGIIKFVALTYPGIGYTGNPTVAVGGAGAAGAITATQTNATIPFFNAAAKGYIYPSSVSIGNGGTGYVGAPPIPLRFNIATNVLINAPFITTGNTTGANSMLWPWVAHGANSNGQHITILNDSVSALDNGHYTSGDFIGVGGDFGHDQIVRWMTNSGGNGTQFSAPVGYWLNAVPAFP